MEIPPDTLEDFLTKTERVPAPWSVSTSFLPMAHLRDFFENIFGSKNLDHTGEL
jgi:hypothetical protein